VAALIARRARDRPEQLYLLHARREEVVTYGELASATARFAQWFQAAGVGAGETVGVAVGDPLRGAVAFLATVACGRTVAPVDPASPDPVLATGCHRVEPRLVLSDRRPPAGVDVPWVDVDGLAGGAGTTAQPGGAGTPGREPIELSPGEPVDAADGGPTTGAVVLTSSGTTGRPKGIRVAEPQLLHTARAVASHHRLLAGDRGFCPLPLFHINAQVVGLLATLAAGASLVVDDRFHRTGFWKLVHELDVTWINAVPAIINRLVPLEVGEEVPSAIRFVRSASAPLHVATLQRFETATGLIVVETYGMTEAASQITANPLDGPRKPGSVGRPVGAEVRIVDPRRGSAVTHPRGGVGRVEIRGPGVIRAYVDGAHAERFDADGWLDTGDLGRLDEDGHLYLEGRVDDVINRGGEKLYPRTVEEVLLRHRDVVAAAVTGRVDEGLGHVPIAYLVVDGVRGEGDRGRAEAVIEQLRERCADSLSRPARPVAYLVVDALSSGTNGKVRRAELARRAVLCEVSGP
jgi:acyl-CoA synthetase (AMP-forming)/AMP-acid ligase II